MTDPIVVVDYDPAWPDLCAVLRAPVAAALGDVAVAVEHVGSTAWIVGNESDANASRLPGRPLLHQIP